MWRMWICHEEKLERLGPEALRDEELLAILLRTGYEGRNVLEISRGIIKKYPLINSWIWI